MYGYVIILILMTIRCNSRSLLTGGRVMIIIIVHIDCLTVGFDGMVKRILISHTGILFPICGSVLLLLLLLRSVTVIYDRRRRARRFVRSNVFHNAKTYRLGYRTV